jgi:hypothetical protein
VDLKAEKLIRRLNSIQVTPEDMEVVLEAAANAREDLRTFASIVSTIMDKLPKADINYRTAVAFRILALARVAKENQLPGFVSNAEGGVTVAPAAVLAAAKCQLVVAGDQTLFDPAEFLREALRAAPAQGRA